MKKILCLALVLIFAFGALAGCGRGGTTATPSAGGGTIKIGILGPLTGAVAQYGIAVYHGAQLYIDKVNAEGGINGKKIEVISYDDKGDPTEAVNAFTRMVDEGITALIGPVTSKPTLAVVDESVALNMPLITASATAAAVTVNPDTNKVNTNVFRTCFIDPFQGEKMAVYSSQVLNAKTAATIFLKATLRGGT
jgi:branched-chain amino acid transport system substrate-binding protein